MSPGMGQKWGQIWGLEKDPFWTISTYKDFVNTRAILLESMILGCRIPVLESSK